MAFNGFKSLNYNQKIYSGKVKFVQRGPGMMVNKRQLLESMTDENLKRMGGMERWE